MVAPNDEEMRRLFSVKNIPLEIEDAYMLWRSPEAACGI